jgi:hypothetical protein
MKNVCGAQNLVAAGFDRNSLFFFSIFSNAAIAAASDFR